jgi:hypothetical protein
MRDMYVPQMKDILMYVPQNPALTGEHGPLLNLYMYTYIHTLTNTHIHREREGEREIERESIRQRIT